MIAAFCLRPDLSRDATASSGSPARGSATETGCAKPGVGGRLRAIGSLPGRLAQPLAVRLTKATTSTDRTFREFIFEFPLICIFLLLILGLLCNVALIFFGE